MYKKNQLKKLFHNLLLKELQFLEEKNYSVDLSEIESESESKKIIITDTNNHKLSIEIDKFYPFKQIKVFGKLQEQIKPSDNIVDYIPNSSDKNVLIYCHPRKYEDGHYSSDVVDKVILESMLSKPLIYTVDIQGQPNIFADGFGEEFLSYFSNPNPIFDIVFMFDCDGPWSYFQGFNDNKKEDINKIIELINNVLRIIKPGGKLIISKILSKELYNFLHHGFVVTFS